MKKIISGLVLSLAVVLAAGCASKLETCDKATDKDTCEKAENFKDNKACMFRTKDDSATDDKLKKDACLAKDEAEKVCTDAKKANGDPVDGKADCEKAVEKISSLKDKCEFKVNKCVIKA